MRVAILLAAILSSFSAQANIFSCSKRDAKQFVTAVREFEKKFKREIANKTEEQIHNSMQSDFYLMGLLLFPNLLQGKLRYADAFIKIGNPAQRYIETLSTGIPNETELAEWQAILDGHIYKLEKSTPALELEECFSKYERKK